MCLGRTPVSPVLIRHLNGKAIQISFTMCPYIVRRTDLHTKSCARRFSDVPPMHAIMIFITSQTYKQPILYHFGWQIASQSELALKSKPYIGLGFIPPYSQTSNQSWSIFTTKMRFLKLEVYHYILRIPASPFSSSGLVSFALCTS